MDWGLYFCGVGVGLGDMKGVINNIKKLNNLSLPATVLIASIILGGFYYASQISKQKSIEKQQFKELQAETEKQNTDYIAKRKIDCLNIYKTEDEKWGNVSEWRYTPIIYVDTVLNDNCVIIYTDSKTGKDFTKSF